MRVTWAWVALVQEFGRTHPSGFSQLRAALRPHESFGQAGFLLVLVLVNAYTGARWSELVAPRPHDYDEVNRAVPVRAPLCEVAGRLETAKSPKPPGG